MWAERAGNQPLPPALALTGTVDSQGQPGECGSKLIPPFFLPWLWRQPGSQRDAASSYLSLDEHPVPPAAVRWGPGSFPELIRKESFRKAGFMVGSPRDRLLPSMAATAFPRREGGLSMSPASLPLDIHCPLYLLGEKVQR